jgi:hypothetical protein
MLAAMHRALNQTNDERQVLMRFAEKDSEAPDAYLRLMELSAEACVSRITRAGPT